VRGTVSHTRRPVDFFQQIPKYREWTYLGLRLALERKIQFVAQATYVYRTDSPRLAVELEGILSRRAPRAGPDAGAEASTMSARCYAPV
jgi:hypothetical protein